MDPEVKKYFKKILNSFFVGLLWLLAISTLGIYLEMGFINGGLHWYNYVFYPFFLLSLFLLIRFYYKVWKDDFRFEK
jgi:hypothetical protein